MLLQSPRPLLMTPFEISWTDLFSPEEHVLHIRQVLTSLLENKLFVQAKKYEIFVVDSVSCLGFVIRGRRVMADQQKVRAVEEWPLLWEAVQCFLGFASPLPTLR